MRTLRHWLILVASVLFGSSCGSSTDAGAAIDRLEIELRPLRRSYPVADTVRAFVTAFLQNGTLRTGGPANWRSLTPAIARVDHAGLIQAVGRGEATIEVHVDGVTARVTVAVGGVLHRGYILEANQTWGVADTPHVVEQTLGVGHVFGGNPQDTVRLTIEPGVTVRFRHGAGLIFGDIGAAALVIPAGGDAVVMEADSPAPAIPAWRGLWFRHSRSELRNLTLRHCGQDYPFGNPGACILSEQGFGADAELLIDGVTISEGRNGLSLGFGMNLAPGSRNLSVLNTKGYVATIAPHHVAAFPRGGQFSGNDGTEILVTNGRVLETVSWEDVGMPLRFTGDVSFEGPANPVLTLPPGSHLRFDPHGGLSFASGGLIAGETGGAPVVLESSGDGWGGVAIEHAGGSALKNVVLDDCGLSMPCLTIGPQGGGDSGLLVEDVVIRGSHTSGVRMAIGASFNPASHSLTITQSASYPLVVFARNIPSLPDGDYRFNGIDAIDVVSDYGIGYDSVSWRNLGVPYRFRSGLGVDSTLVLEPGVTIQVGLGMRVTAGLENLVAVGTAAEPIVFTSVTPGIAGSWMGIELGGGLPGPGTRFEHVVIADAGAGPGGYAGAIRLWSDPGGLLRNSTIVRSASCGFVLFGGAAWTDDYTDLAFGNTFTAVAGPLRCQPPF